MTCHRAIRRAPTGHRIGESHHRAKLTDTDVDNMRELHEVHGLTYDDLVDKFETPKSTIQYICSYKSRC